MKEIGQKLREARISKNMTHEMLFEKTRISVDTISAIEKGEIGNLPKPHFRAFVRTLAMEVGLEPGALLREYDSRQKRYAEEQESFQASEPFVPRLQQFWDKRRKHVLLFTFLVFLSILIGLYVRFGEILFSDPQPQEIITADSDSLQFQEFTLQLIALKGCWIDVQVDSSVQENRYIEQSQRLSWTGQKEIVLGISHGEGVLLLLNGVELDSKSLKNQQGVDVWINNNGIQKIQARPPKRVVKKKVEEEVEKTPDLKGFINTSDLLKQFPDWILKRDGYSPEPDTIAQIKALEVDISLLCFFRPRDTLSAEIIPRLLRIYQMCEFSPDSLKLFVMNQEREDDTGLVRQHRIMGLPTILFFYQKEELGRIVGSPDTRLENLFLKIVEKSKYLLIPNEKTHQDTVFEDVGNR